MKKLYFGTLNGVLTNYTFNQEIPINGEISGNLAEDARPIEENYYYFGCPSGYIISINTISGVFINPEPLLTINDHVLDIKSVNTLGRKELSKQHPILGENLDKTTKNVDEYEQFGFEQWQLVEYINEYDGPIPIEQPLPDNINTTLQSQSSPRRLLASPHYIRSMNNLQNNSTIENNINEQTLDEDIEYIYCGYLIDDILTIKKYKSTDIIDNTNLLLGPLNDFDKLFYEIMNYINIYNKQYEQISEFEYKLSDYIYPEVIGENNEQ